MLGFINYIKKNNAKVQISLCLFLFIFQLLDAVSVTVSCVFIMYFYVETVCSI